MCLLQITETCAYIREQTHVPTWEYRHMCLHHLPETCAYIILQKHVPTSYYRNMCLPLSNGFLCSVVDVFGFSPSALGLYRALGCCPCVICRQAQMRWALIYHTALGSSSMVYSDDSEANMDCQAISLRFLSWELIRRLYRQRLNKWEWNRSRAPWAPVPDHIKVWVL